MKMALCIDYSKEDDVSKIYIYESVLQTLFEDLSMKREFSISRKLLTALKDSKQDVRQLCFVDV